MRDVHCSQFVCMCVCAHVTTLSEMRVLRGFKMWHFLKAICSALALFAYHCCLSHSLMSSQLTKETAIVFSRQKNVHAQGQFL